MTTESDQAEPQEYKLCKRGHVRSPENVYNDGSCKACRKAYRKSPQQVDYNKKRKSTQRYKELDVIRNQKRAPKQRLRAKIRRQLLPDNYIKSEMGFRAGQMIPPELIALKRQQLLFKRELKKMREAVSG